MLWEFHTRRRRRRVFHRTVTALNREREEPMNKDQVTGKIDQVVGKIKQNVGEAVGSDDLANKGVIDQAKGAVKETWGKAKDAAQQVQESRKEAAAEKADGTRGKIASLSRTPRTR
jgi:uncharacterized protein YjbJ (UPF0337 family)